LQIDPTKFKWVNSDNIKPGAKTCGFLHTNLGAEPGVNYPIIKVYICVKFAINQPAPSGNIVMHCGGPGSASGCGIGKGSASVIGKENADNYNIIGIDQVRNKYPFFPHAYVYVLIIISLMIRHIVILQKCLQYFNQINQYSILFINNCFTERYGAFMAVLLS
jgi:hypothetical protein